MLAAIPRGCYVPVSAFVPDDPGKVVILWQVFTLSLFELNTSLVCYIIHGMGQLSGLH